ncbi:MAG: phosphotransferase, partial [Anaerolineales bacterium]
MSILDHTPGFNNAEAAQLAKQSYNLDCSANPLPSERDQNFLLRTDKGERFVLKIANGAEEHAMLEAQNEAMGYVAKSVSFCPHLIPTTRGEGIATVQSRNGAKHFVRLVTYLPGMPLGNVKRHSGELLYDLGYKIGQLTNALQDFDQPALHRDFHWDLANGLVIVHKNEKLVRDKTFREAIFKLTSDFERHATPLLPDLPQSIIHNDANDYNLLAGGGDDPYTKNQNIVGLIDFGDMVYSYTIGDLAVAIAYAILDKPDPLATASQIVKGYHSAHPLEESELTVLFGLVNMRLCMSACIAAEQQASQPNNAYLGISQEPIRNTLPKLAAIHPRFAEAVFREACGLRGFPASETIVNWLTSHADEFASPLNLNLRAGPVTILDLSISSPLFSSDPDQNAEPTLTPRIETAITEKGAQIGVGRYNEARYFYINPAFATGDKATD